MDKYDGISRAETSAAAYSYEVRHKNPNVSAQAPADAPAVKKKGGRAWTAVRYLLCALLLGVALAGRFTDFLPAEKASAFIKEQLERDLTQEINTVLDKNKTPDSDEED